MPTSENAGAPQLKRYSINSSKLTQVGHYRILAKIVSDEGRAHMPGAALRLLGSFSAPLRWESIIGRHPTRFLPRLRVFGMGIALTVLAYART